MVEGSIGNLRSLISTIKQYGDLPEFQNYTIEFKQTFSNDNDNRLGSNLIKKIQQHVASFHNSQALIKQIYESRKSEIYFIFVFSIILMVIVLIVLIFPIYALVREFNEVKICTDPKYYGADVNRMKPYTCTDTKTKKDFEINKEESELASQLLGIYEKYTEQVNQYNKATATKAKVAEATTSGDAHTDSITDLKKTANEAVSQQYANVTITKDDVSDYVKFRFYHKTGKRFMWIFTAMLIAIYILIISVVWFTTQKDNAEATLDIDVLAKVKNSFLTNIVKKTYDDIDPIDIDSLATPSQEKKYQSLNELIKNLKGIYDSYDAIIESLDRIDSFSMMRAFEKSAGVIDKFLSKENDDEQGVKLTSQQKQTIIKTEVVPAFAVKFTKLKGVYYDSPTSTQKDKPNVICQEVLSSNIDDSHLIRDLQNAHQKVIKKIEAISLIRNSTLMFVCLHSDDKTNIKMTYLYLDKTKDYNQAEFTDMRKFKVLKKETLSDAFASPIDEKSYTWMSNDMLNSSNITLDADNCEKTKPCTGTYYLNIFRDENTLTTTTTAPLLRIIIRDQPLSFLESLTWLQGNIRDKIYDVMVKYKFKITLLDYTVDIISSLHDSSMSSLIENEVKECYNNIINDVDQKVQETHKLLQVEDSYISFDRFKIKFAALTSHDVCKDFAYNMVLMKQYSESLSQHYEHHVRYFSDQEMYLKIYRIFVYIILIVIICWFGLIAWKQGWQFGNRQLLKKIDFLLNMDMPDDKRVPRLKTETSLEMAKEIVMVFGVKIILLLVGLSMGWAIFYANYKKSENILHYNHNMILVNTNYIKHGIDNALFYLTKTNNNTENVNTFGVYPLNTMLSSSSTNTSSPLLTDKPLRLIARLIKDNASLMTAPVKLGADDRELREVYDSLVNVLISYKNDNSILMTRNTKAIFPYVDIVTNGVMLLGCLVLLLYLYSTMNPKDIIEKAREFNIAIKENQIDQIECLLSAESRFYEINNIVIIVCIVVIATFFVLMNITKVISSGSGYNIFLFNSPLYDNRMTYNMKY